VARVPDTIDDLLEGSWDDTVGASRRP
jgi:hypothetical protein